MTVKKEKDPITQVETTGHEWDGIKELNNPAPRWWLIVFYITIIWAIGYWIVYPAWPTINGNTKGIYNWSQYSKLENEQAEIIARRAKYLDQFSKSSLAEIYNNDELQAFAIAGGRSFFKDNCATCHGTGAEGGFGYPNLNDDDWLWGGKLEDIYTTISYGIRSTHDDTRFSEMPAFLKDGFLTENQVKTVTEYVLNLNNQNYQNAEAKEIFMQQCASCHGNDAKGNQEVGAPNLKDAIWLYGNSYEEVFKTIAYARNNVMPNWNERLDDDTIKQLSIYVYSLGGGE